MAQEPRQVGCGSHRAAVSFATRQNAVPVLPRTTTFDRDIRNDVKRRGKDDDDGTASTD